MTKHGGHKCSDQVVSSQLQITPWEFSFEEGTPTAVSGLAHRRNIGDY